MITKHLLPAVSALLTAAFIAGAATPEPTSQNETAPIPNEAIDYNAFKRLVVEGQSIREQKRLTEEQFLQAMHSEKFVLLDARSKANYELRHVRGAINLPFTEFTAETLARVIPAKDAKILIYCNNNFNGDPQSMALKSVAASLNVNTQASLRAYGYNDVYELGPYLDVRTTRIPFAGSGVDSTGPQR